MSKNNVVTLCSYHKHIDNGGLTIDFTAESCDASILINPAITFTAQFFGYTSVSSTINGRDLTADDLREIGLKFIEASIVWNSANSGRAG